MYRFYNLQSGSDHNISLYINDFVDDERFLKNYNLKIYFGQGWPGPRINRYNSAALFIILSLVITLKHDVYLVWPHSGCYIFAQLLIFIHSNPLLNLCL